MAMDWDIPDFKTQMVAKNSHACILQDIQIATLEQKTKTVTFKTSGEGKGRCVNTQVFFFLARQDSRTLWRLFIPFQVGGLK
jgi:carbon monoxide dehydrogenase subunit G